MIGGVGRRDERPIGWLRRSARRGGSTHEVPDLLEDLLQVGDGDAHGGRTPQAVADELHHPGQAAVAAELVLDELAQPSFTAVKTSLARESPSWASRSIATRAVLSGSGSLPPARETASVADVRT